MFDVCYVRQMTACVLRMSDWSSDVCSSDILDWAGLVSEAIIGQTHGTYLSQHVFAPLAMRDTAFVMRDDMRARKAKIHQRVDGNLVPHDLEQPPPAEVRSDERRGGKGCDSTCRSVW